MRVVGGEIVGLVGRGEGFVDVIMVGRIIRHGKIRQRRMRRRIHHHWAPSTTISRPRRPAQFNNRFNSTNGHLDRGIAFLSRPGPQIIHRGFNTQRAGFSNGVLEI